MVCVVCKGNRIITKNDQVIVCGNCEGTGEIITQEDAFGSDCKGNCQ